MCFFLWVYITLCMIHPFPSSSWLTGMHRICLIILNQPLDKDYLHILWSKGVVYFRHYGRSSLTSLCHWRFHLHWFAQRTNSLVVRFFWLCSLCNVLIAAMSLKISPPCSLPTLPARWVLIKSKMTSFFTNVLILIYSFNASTPAMSEARGIVFSNCQCVRPYAHLAIPFLWLQYPRNALRELIHILAQRSTGTQEWTD